MEKALNVFRNNAIDKARSDRKLQESEEKYRSIFNNAPLGILHFNENGTITSCNDEFVKIIGSSRAALVGLNMLDLPDKHLVEAVRQAINGNLAVYEEEYHSVTANKITPVHALFASIFSKDGEVTGGVGIILDITDRKQAEEKIGSSLLEKEILLREIHHRVKNNLQVISSLLDLQSSYLQDEKARKMLHNSMDRIKTMARVHTMLYQSQNLARIDLGGFIGDLADRLQQSYGGVGEPVAIGVDVPAGVSLTIETSIPCGLILNELVSNALKHAFPEGREGISM